MANQDKQQRPGDRFARPEPEARADLPADERSTFPAATDPRGGPHETNLPQTHAQMKFRTDAEEAEAARLSREAADDPLGVPGRNVLAIFDAPTIAKGLKISTADAERLIDVLLVRLGRGDAEERGGRFLKAACRVARGDSVDDVLRDAGKEAGADKPRVEHR